MSLLVEFDEFKGLSHDQFMEELDKILLISINKLRDNMDLRRRVMLFPTFEKVIQYRKVELLTQEEQADETY
ncbi:hypothetical protein GCK72_012151 [Caenorhabditis remanei]|uniref:Uncharacterized protein n=2 Tax=Caenorhabditis remanei TaxID=31234 RepID=E3MEL1_CAERE|nr:hypothetical protein GCK72_012151 [Caenorhabditis remanei]EFP00463.1 hypothetical protein CRE_21809 [Caenorhabditis remanei]KAF1755701.1 hypothetical protein GCK72_012151 [Caenorhabditis remanei]